MYIAQPSDLIGALKCRQHVTCTVSLQANLKLAVLNKKVFFNVCLIFFMFIICRHFDGNDRAMIHFLDISKVLVLFFSTLSDK